jgi:methylated-DNA-[protein]-cysteine S-methyltransferase
MPIFINYYDLPLGSMGIVEENEMITAIFFAKEQNNITAIHQETPLIKKAYLQLAEYFDGKRKSFDLPLAPQGTSFQQKVWQAIQSVPYGSTKSYKDIAKLIGNIQSCRAVGNANNRNPIVIIIPCHRVIGIRGDLVGYANGLDTKEKLLQLEKAYR